MTLDANLIEPTTSTQITLVKGNCVWPFKKKQSIPPTPKPRPELKQFGDLRPGDFARHPVWVNCHTIDYDEAWYDDTTEETFRPYSGVLPVGHDQMYLVHCACVLADGTKLDGFATPASDKEDWGAIQPQVFLTDGSRVGMWLGMFGQEGLLKKFCLSLGKEPSQVFPLSITPFPALTSAECSGTIHGFMKKKDESFEIMAR